MMEFLKYFLLKFWPHVLDDIWHDCKALVRAIKDTRAIYKRQVLVNKRALNPSQLGLYQGFQPHSNFGVEQRRKVMRFGHDPIKHVLGKQYPDGTNIYRASLLNLKSIDSHFAGAKYRYTPLLVIFVWAIRNIVFKRHFKGWFRSYLFKNVQRVKEYTYGYIYSFGAWWPIASLRWLLVRVVFRTLTNLLFLGPVFKFAGVLYGRLPAFPRLPPFPARSRSYLFRERFVLFCRALCYAGFRFTPAFILRPFDIILRVFVALDVLGVIFFSIIRRIFVIVTFPAFLFVLFFLNRVVRFIRQLLCSRRATLIFFFVHKRLLYVFQYFSYVFYFKCMLVRHLSAIRIRIRLKRKKPNPIRRFSNWITYTRYKLSRYQVEKVFYTIGQFFLVLPVRFSNTATFKFLSRPFFQAFFWRGFPFQKPYLAHFLSEQTSAKFFSYFSVYDDFTLTNFFSNETAFPNLRLLFYEYDDWSASFEEFDEFEDHLLDMSSSIRSRRQFIVNLVASAIKTLGLLPTAVFRIAFSGGFWWRLILLPYKVVDCVLAFISFLWSGLRAIFYFPVYTFLYLATRVRTFKLVFDINLRRSERYGLYSFIYFVLAAIFSLFLFLEFFFIFGTYILVAQEFLMRNLDSYTYNFLFLLLLPLFVLSLVSSYFAEVWREAKYYLFTYPLVVHGWLLFYLIRWVGKKKFGLVGNFVDYLNKDSFWFNDALHPVLGYLYLNWQPFLRYKRFTSARPDHGGELDLKQATFDFVTSLF